MGLFKKQEPIQVEIRDHQLLCHVCQHDAFWRREAKLNTTLAEFFEVAWANRSAVCYVCAQCGFVHWFLPT
jgi:hypothetical protein